MRIRVVLPQPDGPRKTTSELRAMASEVSCATTGTSPKILVDPIEGEIVAAIRLTDI